MTKDEALKLALEALALAGGNLCEALHHPKKLQHGIGEPCPAVAKYDKAIAAIKEALALTSTKCEVQPSQEHVAWMYDDDNKLIPLFTAPPQEQQSCDKRPWVGLTDKEKKEIYRLSVYVEGAISLTEAKLKEKNT